MCVRPYIIYWIHQVAKCITDELLLLVVTYNINIFSAWKSPPLWVGRFSFYSREDNKAASILTHLIYFVAIQASESVDPRAVCGFRA